LVGSIRKGKTGENLLEIKAGNLANQIEIEKLLTEGTADRVLDTLPKHNVFLVTCNSDIDSLEQRVHSRFNAFAIEGSTIEELTQFLTSRWNIRADFAGGVHFAARPRLVLL